MAEATDKPIRTVPVRFGPSDAALKLIADSSSNEHEYNINMSMFMAGMAEAMEQVGVMVNGLSNHFRATIKANAEAGIEKIAKEIEAHGGSN